MDNNNYEIWNRFIEYENENSAELDKYDRKLFATSGEKNLTFPIVSNFLRENGLNPVYPENKTFGLCISHDIDCLGTRNAKVKSIFESPLTFISKANSVTDLIKNFTRKREIVFDNGLSKIHEINKKYNVHSSFYLLALNSGELDFNYALKDIKVIINEIIENNGEIGLHGGFNAYFDLEKLKQEKELLESSINQKVYGYRGHYLKFKTPETWQLLEKLNLDYDTTYGYPDQIGFRNGICHPFRPYSVKENRFLDIFELPLAIMDTTMTKYMGLSLEEQFSKCKQLIDLVEENNGVLSLLWHNDNLKEAACEMYEEVIKYASLKNAWMPSGKEMIDFWKEKKYDEIQLKALNSLKRKVVSQ